MSAKYKRTDAQRALRNQQYERQGREMHALPTIHWLDEPATVPGSKLRILGIASDAAPELLAEYGITATVKKAA